MEVVNVKVEVYLEQYKMLVISEMEDYGILVSIIFVQGLLEFNVGESLFVREFNNYFGIKCKSKCWGCICCNYLDDDFYDMFWVFGDVKESFWVYFELFNGDWYKYFYWLCIFDYKGWVYGLKKVGYVIDKVYVDKFIWIIEQLDLIWFDWLGVQFYSNFNIFVNVLKIN